MLEIKRPKQFTGPFKYNPSTIAIHAANDRMVLDIRGWGYLTGKASLNLSDEDATNIQDQFGYWVANKLNRIES